MSRLLPVALVLLAAGCTTVVPMQTASTVAPGGYRFAAQVTGTPYCTLGISPLASCQAAPSTGSALPATLIPEARLNARHGAAQGLDFGLSLHAIPSPSSAFRGGAFLDGKYELVSRPAGDGRQLISVGIGGGVTAGLPTLTRPSLTQVELAVPVFLGWQLRRVEWVLSPRIVQRLGFADVDADGDRDVLPVTELGLAAGLHTRGDLSFSLQLGYSASVGALAQGPFTLALGASFDLPPRAAPQVNAPAEE